MKTLLIITSIILISFQIDRLVVNNLEKSVTKTEVKFLNADFLTKPAPPEITSTYRSVKSLKKEAVVSNHTHALRTVAAAKKGSVVKTRFKTNYSKQLNNTLRLMHKLNKESGTFIAFGKVQFDFNKHNALTTKEFNTILQFASKLIFDESLKISVAGFADSKGNVEYNEELSWLRANDVKDYLVELGVKEDRIMISANGVSDPIADNDSNNGRAANRRVEMLLIQ